MTVKKTIRSFRRTKYFFVNSGQNQFLSRSFDIVDRRNVFTKFSILNVRSWGAEVNSNVALIVIVFQYLVKHLNNKVMYVLTVESKFF